RRIDQRLGGEGGAMRVLFEPERVALGDFGIGTTHRPSPPLRYSLSAFGCTAYFKNSLATSTFFAPLGISAPKLAIGLGIFWPSLPRGMPRVTMSSYSALFL